MSEPSVDDPSIADDDPLWRRIPPRHFKRDQPGGVLRPASAAFDNHPDGSPMSVVLGKQVLKGGRSPADFLANFPGYGLVSFPAGLARKHRQFVVRSPLPDEPAHAEVHGKKTRGTKRALAKGCSWLIAPGL